MNETTFQIALDAQIQDKHLLTHEFYQAWNRGELSMECLKEYAKEYYQHVKAFPTYLSALHSHTDNAHTRRELLQNLIEEEAGKPNHPDLWRTFAQSLGCTDAEIDSYTPNAAMQKLIDDFKHVCLKGTVSEGLAALYSYESQIPAVSESKIKGLKAHYGLTDPKAWSYFSVHIAADEEHAAVERQLLANHFSKEGAEATLAASKATLNNLWDFLTSLCHKHNVCCTA